VTTFGPFGGAAPVTETFVTSILECVVQPVFVVDQGGLIRFANASAVGTLGYADVSELLGRPVHQTLHYKRSDGTAMPAGECLMSRPRTTGQAVHSEDWLVRQDGSMIPVEYWSAPIDTPDGRGVVFSFTDLTSIQARQRAILEAALDGVLSIDQHARITYVNTGAMRIFGCPADELIGRELGEAIVPPALREQHRLGFARYLATGDAHILDRRIEVTAMRADGSEFPAELTVTRTGLPGAVGFTGFIRDITERHRAEQEVIAARTELVASRARMVTAFDAARQRVTRDLHDGAQQMLVSCMINLQLAQQEWSSSPERSRQLLDRALRDVKGGIDSLREIAAGIHPAILTQRGLAAALSGLAARLALPVELDIVATRLPRPIESSVYFFCSEALTNVVKHARAGFASVRVALQDDRCTVEVRDDGIGGAVPRAQGSGLTGLRDRIGALHGAMEVSSPVAVGTTLRAWIPLPVTPLPVTPLPVAPGADHEAGAQDSPGLD
jgi:PAS domain S-box-containing protein